MTTFGKRTKNETVRKLIERANEAGDIRLADAWYQVSLWAGENAEVTADMRATVARLYMN